MTRLTRERRRELDAYHSARPVRFFTLSRRAMLRGGAQVAIDQLIHICRAACSKHVPPVLFDAWPAKHAVDVRSPQLPPT